MSTEIRPAPCAWCKADNMDTHASFNGGDICVDCEEQAIEEQPNNTKLSWTDADLAEAVDDARTAGEAIANAKLLKAITEHPGIHAIDKATIVKIINTTLKGATK